MSVHSLQTSSEGSLLDPDDTLLDVVDDREQVGFTSWGISVLPAHEKMSRGMRFPTIWYVRPAKAQTSLRLGAV